MCLARVYRRGNGEEELLLEDIARVEIDGPTLRLSTLFGEEREIDAVLKAVDFENSTLTVERRAATVASRGIAS